MPEFFDRLFTILTNGGVVLGRHVPTASQATVERNAGEEIPSAVGRGAVALHIGEEIPTAVGMHIGEEIPQVGTAPDRGQVNVFGGRGGIGGEV